jgi:hypothetical protein
MAIFSVYSNARVAAIPLKETVHRIEAVEADSVYPRREYWVRDQDIPVSTFKERLGDYIGTLAQEGRLRQYEMVDPNTGATFES